MPALLLNEGMILNFDVIVLLGETIKEASEYGPAALILGSHHEISPRSFL